MVENEGDGDYLNEESIFLTPAEQCNLHGIMVENEGNGDYLNEESIFVAPAEQCNSSRNTPRQRLLKTLLIDMSFVAMVGNDYLR